MNSEPLLIIIAYVVLGLVGAATRICVQRKRDKKWNNTPDEVFCELFIGGVAGLICYFIGDSYLLSLGFGYAGPDAVEALLKEKAPFKKT